MATLSFVEARLSKDASNPARWVRAARNRRRISQRELAAISGVPHATIERIESSRSSPRVATLEALLRATGFEIVIQDSRERELAIDEDREGRIDRGGRRFPAHLVSMPVSGDYELPKPGYINWWGWNHIAWPDNGDWVPSHTYWRRKPREVVVIRPPLLECNRLWDDAT